MKVLCRGLVGFLLLFFVTGCAWVSPVKKIVKNKDKWGGLEYPGVYELQQDVLLKNKRALAASVTIYGSYPEVTYNVEQFRNKEVRLENVEILVKGTLMELSKMTYADVGTYIQVNVYANILSGEHKGLEVSIGSFADITPFPVEKIGIKGLNEKYIKLRE